MRLRTWAATGAVVGVVLALLSVTDARNHLPESWHISDNIDYYICYWAILGFAHWRSDFTFHAAVIFLNACTFALPFFLFGALVLYVKLIVASGKRA